jgi:hypothetical protein
MDALRENTMTPRMALNTETMSTCMQLKDAVIGLVGRL